MSDVLIAVAMLGALALIGTGGWLLVQGRGSRLRAGLQSARPWCSPSHAGPLGSSRRNSFRSG